MTDLPLSVMAFLRQERLPPVFSQTAARFFEPLADQIAKRTSRHASPFVVGINGAQGSGKSTLAEFLKLILEAGYGLKSAVLSIDDLYLTRKERQNLAQKVHPLFITRGVPGTHDITLGCQVLDQLAGARPGDCTLIPRFDKSKDDRVPHDQCDQVTGRPDIVILEGWCVGAVSQKDSEMIAPVNLLEEVEDRDGAWRRYVNLKLETMYPELFRRIDYLVMLKVPDFDCVREWRLLQEKKLKDRVAGTAQGSGGAIMDARSLDRFLMHYERLTRHMLGEVPGRADVVMELDREHQVVSVGNKASGDVYP